MPTLPDISGYVKDANGVRLPAATPRAGATAGEPHEAALVLHKDDELEIGIWECSPGRFPGVRSGYNELMVFTKGAGAITPQGGDPLPLQPGTVYPTLDGWVAEWDVTETVRKVYVIWNDTRA